MDGELLDHEAPGVWSGLTFTSLVVGTVVIPLVFWPWSEDVFVGPKFDVLRLWVTGAALIGGTWYLTSGRRVRIMWPDVFLGAYLVLNGVAFAVSIDHRTSFFGEPLQQAGLLTVVALSATYVIARVSVNTARRLVVLSSGIALAGAIVAAYAVVQLAGADPLWSSLPQGRAFSTIGQPNWLAAYLVITIPLTLGLTIVAKRTEYRIAGLLGFLLQVTALIATRSRSGYLGLAAVALIGLVLLVRHVRNGGRIHLEAVGAAAAALAIAGVLIIGLSRSTSEIEPASLARRAISTFDATSFDARRYTGLWGVGVAVVADHPLWGTGQDTYAIVFPDYRDETLEPEVATHFAAFRPESPHNVYVGIAAGSGIPALLAYLGIVAGSAWALLRSIPRGGRVGTLAAAMLAALGGHLVTDFFMTMDLSGSWLMWALMGAAVTIADRVARRDASPLPPSQTRA